MTEKFVSFNRIQRRLITEVMERTQKEINETLIIIYEDLGIAEKLSKGDCSFLLRSDYSGLDVVESPKSKEEEK